MYAAHCNHLRASAVVRLVQGKASCDSLLRIPGTGNNSLVERSPKARFVYFMPEGWLVAREIWWQLGAIQQTVADRISSYRIGTPGNPMGEPRWSVKSAARLRCRVTFSLGILNVKLRSADRVVIGRALSTVLHDSHQIALAIPVGHMAAKWTFDIKNCQRDRKDQLGEQRISSIDNKRCEVVQHRECQCCQRAVYMADRRGIRKDWIAAPISWHSNWRKQRRRSGFGI